MAHYVASVNLYQHPEHVNASVKVYRVFDYGAAPRHPVWERQITLARINEYQPQAYLKDLLRELLRAL